MLNSSLQHYIDTILEVGTELRNWFQKEKNSQFLRSVIRRSRFCQGLIWGVWYRVRPVSINNIYIISLYLFEYNAHLHNKLRSSLYINVFNCIFVWCNVGTSELVGPTVFVQDNNRLAHCRNCALCKKTKTKIGIKYWIESYSWVGSVSKSDTFNDYKNSMNVM